MIDENLRLDNYDYILNKKSIANYPSEKRDESKSNDKEKDADENE